MMKPRTDPTTCITRAVPDLADVRAVCRTVDNVRFAAHLEKDADGETLADLLKAWIEKHPIMPARKRGPKTNDPAPNQNPLPFDPDPDKADAPADPPATTKRRPRATV